MKKQPERLDILKSIYKNFIQILHWIPNFEYCIEYQNQIEALLEILETHDCGSTGGFDWEVLKKFGITNEALRGYLNIYYRFIIVLYKYNNLKDLGKLSETKKYMKKLATLYKTKRFYDILKNNKFIL
jgi:hypothetical protein